MEEDQLIPCEKYAALLSLMSDSSGHSGADDVDKDLLAVISFASLCLERFSGMKRYRKKLWHDFALNGGVQPIKALLRSTLLSDPVHQRVHLALSNVLTNLGIDISDLGITIDPSTYMTVRLLT